MTKEQVQKMKSAIWEIISICRSVNGSCDNCPVHYENDVSGFEDCLLRNEDGEAPCNWEVFPDENQS